MPFDKVEEVLLSAGLDPSDPATAARLWNYDETAFCTCTSVSATRLIVHTGTKMVHELGVPLEESAQQYTAQVVPLGERLPPFILYKGKNLYWRLMEGGPAATAHVISDSGWMDGINFLSWFTKLFLPAVAYLTNTAPVLMILDSLFSLYSCVISVHSQQLPRKSLEELTNVV